MFDKYRAGVKYNMEVAFHVNVPCIPVVEEGREGIMVVILGTNVSIRDVC